MTTTVSKLAATLVVGVLRICRRVGLAAPTPCVPSPVAPAAPVGLGEQLASQEQRAEQLLEAAGIVLPRLVRHAAGYSNGGTVCSPGNRMQIREETSPWVTIPVTVS
jgi:hypothetical protein